ncbi:hypothetical protein ACUXAV_005039 [Cupriavidus metallidurans]|jgi:hypothetical protein|nr:hypothetical protein Cmtc_60030 [Cupriavidus sp. TKC]
MELHPTVRDGLTNAAQGWREQEELYRQKSANEGGNPAALAMAKVCADAATSLEMQAQDGVPRCACCLKPIWTDLDLRPYWKR